MNNMNRIRNCIIAAIVSAPAAAGLALAAPATADPDLGHQVCSLIDQQGPNPDLRAFLNIDKMLMQHGHPRDFNIVVHQSVANDCPPYSTALAEADRGAGGIVGGIMDCPSGTTYVPSLGRCRVMTR
jgi:hypothetical protein